MAVAILDFINLCKKKSTVWNSNFKGNTCIYLSLIYKGLIACIKFKVHVDLITNLSTTRNLTKGKTYLR